MEKEITLDDLLFGAAAYKGHKKGDYSTDEELKAAAKVMEPIARFLVAMGPEFAFAARECLLFSQYAQAFLVARKENQAREISSEKTL